MRILDGKSYEETCFVPGEEASGDALPMVRNSMEIFDILFFKLTITA